MKLRQATLDDEASPLPTIAIAPRQVVHKAATAIVVVPALVAILGHACEEPKVPFGLLDSAWLQSMVSSGSSCGLLML